MELTPTPEKRTMYEGPKLSRSSTGRSIPRSRAGRLFPLLVLVAPVAGAAWYFATHPEVTPQESLARLAEGWQDVRGEISRRAGKQADDPSRRAADGRRRTRDPEDPSVEQAEPAEPPKPAMSVTSLAEPDIPAERRTTLLLKNGEQVSGEVVSETADTIVLQWGHGQAGFNRSEVLQITRPSAATPGVAAEPPGAPAPAAREVTLFLKNGGVVTGVLVQELPDQVILKFDYGEVAFHRAEIDRIQ